MLTRTRVWEYVTLECKGVIPASFSSAFSHSLRTNKCIVKNLVLTSNSIEGWEAIAMAAVTGTSMRSLYLLGTLPRYMTYIGDFAKELSSNSSLQEVKFRGCVIPESECAAAFVESVARNYSIEFLDVGLTTNSEEACSNLCWLNRSGRKYMVQENTIDNGIALLSKFVAPAPVVVPEPVHESERIYRSREADRGSLNCIFVHLRENVGTFFVDGMGDRMRERDLVQGLLQEERNLATYRGLVLASEERLAKLRAQQETQRNRDAVLKLSEVSCRVACRDSLAHSLH
jgi:hypothetical protein